MCMQVHCICNNFQYMANDIKLSFNGYIKNILVLCCQVSDECIFIGPEIAGLSR